MKTEAQFNLLAMVYRKEATWRAVLYIVVLIAASMIFATLALLLIRLLGHSALDNWICAVLFTPALIVMNLYLVKSKENLARKLDLVCPNCFHALRPDDNKMKATTDKCPWCRSRIFI